MLLGTHRQEKLKECFDIWDLNTPSDLLPSSPGLQSSRPHDVHVQGRITHDQTINRWTNHQKSSKIINQPPLLSVFDNFWCKWAEFVLRNPLSTASHLRVWRATFVTELVVGTLLDIFQSCSTIFPWFFHGFPRCFVSQVLPGLHSATLLDLDVTAAIGASEEELPAEDINNNNYHDMEVSWNRGTSKSSISRWYYNGISPFFHYKPSILGYPHLWKPLYLTRWWCN